MKMTFYELNDPMAKNDHYNPYSSYPPQFQQDEWRNFRRARAPRKCKAAMPDPGCVVSQDKEKFQVTLNVKCFTLGELTVKTVDKTLVIEGDHGEKPEQTGFVSRSFTRKYELPEGAQADLVVSSLSPDGVLTVTAPFKVPPKNERIVPISLTGPTKTESSAVVEEGTPAEEDNGAEETN
ncbi:protein lethal(2)essential for life-like [Anticarsia gemmatalis]|uniref:protein lethal(2)essential for life-like n=1 Tax=Anticarsia gemmatalis TaxID=129554 RepID=UPI003F760B75